MIRGVFGCEAKERTPCGDTLPVRFLPVFGASLVFLAAVVYGNAYRMAGIDELKTACPQNEYSSW